MFILALNYEGKRQEYYNADWLELLGDTERLVRSEITVMVVSLDRAACGSEVADLAPERCALLKRVNHLALKTGDKRDPSELAIPEYLDEVARTKGPDSSAESRREVARVDALNAQLK